MTSLTPDEPAPFAPVPNYLQSAPNPRTVRADDLTWYNSRGGYIYKSSFDRCTGESRTTKDPYNRLVNPPNEPFLKGVVPRFDLYGIAKKTCQCELDRCCQNNKHSTCALYGGMYADPN